METGNKFIITKLSICGRVRTVYAYFEDGRVSELGIVPRADDGTKGMLGNIYVGKVKNLAENIGAAFIEIADGVVCHFSLAEMKKYPLIFTGVKKGDALKPGDELLVQVCREAVGSKPPTVTGNLTFTGRYLVLTAGKRQVGVSSKLGPEERERLRAVTEEIKGHLISAGAGDGKAAGGSDTCPEFGLIARTNAAGIPASEMEKEAAVLLSLLRGTVRVGLNLAPFCLAYREPPYYVSRILGLPMEGLLEILTDDGEIFKELEGYLDERCPEMSPLLRLYEKEAPSLDAVYGISKEFEGALKTKVWLKSGGYLVIEPTEALTVIDVNTGKFSGSRHKKDAILKTNLEAAAETARQLRLRNLSGIIIVDFIDMESKEEQELLIKELKACLRKDPVKTEVVDMTALGLVEITRKKTRAALKEDCGKS